MNWKEFLFTVLAVAVGMVLAGLIKSKLPASLTGGWEESFEKE